MSKISRRVRPSSSICALAHADEFEVIARRGELLRGQGERIGGRQMGSSSGVRRIPARRHRPAAARRCLCCRRPPEPRRASPGFRCGRRTRAAPIHRRRPKPDRYGLRPARRGPRCARVRAAGAACTVSVSRRAACSCSGVRRTLPARIAAAAGLGAGVHRLEIHPAIRRLSRLLGAVGRMHRIDVVEHRARTATRVHHDGGTRTAPRQVGGADQRPLRQGQYRRRRRGFEGTPVSYTVPPISSRSRGDAQGRSGRRY